MDNERIAQEVTLRLYESLRIEESLFEVLLYLKNYIPMDNLNVSVYDRENLNMRYLASATVDGGNLIDEKIPLSEEAIKEGDKGLIPGEVVVLNHPEKSILIKGLLKGQLDIPGGIFDPGEKFTAMTLSFDTGSSLLGLCTMINKTAMPYTIELEKRFKNLARPIKGAILNLLDHHKILNHNERLKQDNQELRQRLGFSDAIQIVGAEDGLFDVMKRCMQVADMESPVLLSGETGTGKEVIAHVIHRQSKRKNGPIVCINCGAIPETLVDSELFGHEKGAFTGAVIKKRGYFEQATGGTIFLDEIGELPLSVQVKLLRIIQEKVLYRIGGQHPVSVDIRIIAATHKDLPKLVREKLFREDLWFRLYVFPIDIPPLRERKQDIPALVDYFLKRKVREMHLSFTPRLEKGAIDRLLSYDWPGNVRELENIIERNLIVSRGNPLSFSDVKGNSSALTFDSDSKNDIEPLDEVIIKHIKKALKQTGGKLSGPDGAAALLKINPSTLRGKIRKYKISKKL